MFLLQEEVEARLDAERRLREAEQSLKRLDKAVHTEVNHEEERDAVNEEMKSDVKTLKREGKQCLYRRFTFVKHLCEGRIIQGGSA